MAVFIVKRFNCNEEPLKWLAAVLVLAFAAPLAATTFTVTNTNDSGAGSLRQALLNAQNCTGAPPHTIAFDVPAGSLTNGVAVIAPSSALPPLTCAGTTIDGTTQTANGGNTNDVTLGTGGTVGTGPDGVTGTGDEPALGQLNGPEVEIDGSALTGAILTIQADSVTVRGLSLHGGGDFSGVGTGSGNIDIQSGAGAVVEDNVIGATATSYTNPGGAAQTQNNLIRMTGGSDITVRNNLLGFTRWRSILMFSPVADITIEGNEFTGSSDGIDFCSPGFGPLEPLPRPRTSSTISSPTDPVPPSSGSFTHRTAETRSSRTTRSHGGLRRDHVSPLSASREEQRDEQRDPGHSGPHPGTPPASVTITQNSIFGNSAIGIDLLGNGVTPNDVGDGDAGPNGLQNFPIIKSVEHSGLAVGASTRILGSFHGAASTTFNLEFFANPACSSFPKEFLEGQTYIATEQVTTDGSGNASIDFTFPVETENGVRISATATDPSGNTSELSQRIIFSINPTSGPAAGARL